MAASARGVNGFGRKAAGLGAAPASSAAYPETKSVRNPGRIASRARASAGPLMRGITTSLTRRSMRPPWLRVRSSASAPLRHGSTW